MIAGLPSEQEGVSDEEGRYWWDRVLSDETKKKFIVSLLKDKERQKDYYILTSTKFDDFTPKIKSRLKLWLVSSDSKDLKAKKGISFIGIGKKHSEGGIPVEVERDEQILTSGVSKIKDKIKCEGTGEGIGSALNELGGGVKWSNEGKCKIMKEIYTYREVEQEIDSAYPTDAKRILDIINIPGNFSTTQKKELRIYWRNKFGEHIMESVKNEDQHREDLKNAGYEKGGKMKIKRYSVKLKSDNGVITIHTVASSKESAKKMVLDAGGAPESAIISITSKKLSNGGKIKSKMAERSKIKNKISEGNYEAGGYAGKTQEEIWNGWKYEQRSHFLYDHELDSQNWKLDYNELPEEVKQKLKGHTMMGQYHGGGKIQEYGRFIKINEPQEFKIIEALKLEDFYKLKLVCHNDLLIYGYDAKLAEFLDTYGIHYTEFENYEEVEGFLMKQLPKRIKDKI